MSRTASDQKPTGSFVQVTLSYLFSLPPLLHRVLILSLAGLATGLLFLTFGASLHTFEERLGDLGWTFSPDQSLEQRITIVAIDEPSLQAIGPWPWSRQTMADLSAAIDASGAQLQLHDIVYSEPREEDQALAQALTDSAGAVLAHVPVLQSSQNVRVGQLSHSLSGIDCSAAAMQLPIATDFLSANASFNGIAKGHITPVIDNDGAVRKSPALICIDGQAYPMLALSALLQAIDSDRWQGRVTSSRNFFAPAAQLTLDAYPGLAVPLDREGNLRISYARDPSSYRAVSAVDVLNGNFDSSLFENAWVLVGATAFGMGDIVPTPFNGAAPGVELQARMLGSLLDVNMPYTPAGANWLLAFYAALASGLLIFLAGREGRWSAWGLPVAAILLPLMSLGLHIQLLATMNLWLGWLAPALYSALTASGLLLLELMRVRGERARVFSNLNSYLPGELAREIAYSLPSSSINARRVDVTLLNADLRNFSAFSESRPPEESAALLHYFFTRATSIVERHGGRIHEFTGDGLLAVWQGQSAEAARQALLSALELEADLDSELLPDYAPSGLEPLALGIGIEQGPVLIGSIGPSHRRSHAMLGDTVTVVMRIQELTVELAQPILLGSSVARQLGDGQLQSQGSYLLPGLTSPHTLFAPQAPRDEPQGKTGRRPDLRLLSGGRH